MFDHIDNLFLGHTRRVECEVIALGIAPLLVSEEIVIISPPAVGTLGYCLGLLRCESVLAARDASHTFLHGRVQKQIDDPRMLTEYIIGGTPHHDKRPFPSLGGQEIAHSLVE